MLEPVEFTLHVTVQSEMYRISGGRFGDIWKSPWMTLDEYTLALTDLSPEKREAMLGRISEGGGLPVPFRFSAEDVRKVGLVEQLKPIEIPMNGPVRF